MKDKSNTNLQNTAIICRLSQYRSALQRFASLGFDKIYSSYLAESVGVSGVVVRKDFSTLGIFGKKRGGYSIEELLAQISRILGKNTTLNVVLAGVGNLGRALIRYKNFIKEGIFIHAAFDLDPSKLSLKNTNPPILPAAEMEEYIRLHAIQIGIVAVPDIVAQQVADAMVNAGVVGILNFAPITLRIPPSCAVRNVNLAQEIEALAYYALNMKK
ncbi:MAG: redox-sensing transcriptional repressor Rex [Chitinivibrionales bacterium]|nr:redox-sensing transcriptional repressor Rex [Chitinivibrionales bacterium]